LVQARHPNPQRPLLKEATTRCFASTPFRLSMAWLVMKNGSQ
jgi:hypothetical protein